MIRAVVFDCDGVLSDNGSSWQLIHEYFGTGENDEGDHQEKLEMFLDGKISEEEFVDQFRSLLRDLLGAGARIPKELMLFVKNFAYLASVVQTLDPDMDLLGAFSDIAGGFLARNGLRVATEIGFSVSPDDASDLSLRRAVGLRDGTSTLTWRQLSERRVSMVDRVRPLAELFRSGADL